MNLNNSKTHLEARSLIAGDLFREGKITRCEMFRIEMDAAMLENTGEIRYVENEDFVNWTM